MARSAPEVFYAPALVVARAPSRARRGFLDQHSRAPPSDTGRGDADVSRAWTRTPHTGRDDGVDQASLPAQNHRGTREQRPVRHQRVPRGVRGSRASGPHPAPRGFEMDSGTRPIPLHQEPAKVRPTSPPPGEHPAPRSRFRDFLIRSTPDDPRAPLPRSARRPDPPAYSSSPRDAANGYVIAEICGRYFPVRPLRSPSVPSPVDRQSTRPTTLVSRVDFAAELIVTTRPPVPPQTEINMPSYENGSSMQIKADNWSQLTKFFARCMPRFRLDDDAVEGVARQSPGGRWTFSRRSTPRSRSNRSRRSTAHARRFFRWTAGQWAKWFVGERFAAERGEQRVVVGVAEDGASVRGGAAGGEVRGDQDAPAGDGGAGEGEVGREGEDDGRRRVGETREVK